MSGSSEADALSPCQINSLPTTPSVDVKAKFQDCEETFLDEEGWKEEARGVIKDVEKYVKLVCVSEQLASSRSCIFLNLTTREEKQYTIELTSQGFKVVANEHNANNLADENIYETPYSLLDSISPAYRQAFGDHLTDQLLKLQAAREAWAKHIWNNNMKGIHREKKSKKKTARNFIPPQQPIYNKQHIFNHKNLPNRTSTQPYQRHLVDLDATKNYNNPSADHLRFSTLGGSDGSNNMMSSSDLCPTLIPDSAQYDNTFEVCIKRNSLGLGFSITGGVEAPAPWTNLIRIKNIFPLQPAWQTAQLKIGDVILQVSGVPVSGLSLRQALDILRTSPPLTKLLVCRIPDPVTASNLNSSPTNSNDLKSFANLSLNTDPVGGNSDLLNSAGESMEIDISPSTPEKEWSPPADSQSGDGEDSAPHNTLDLLKPIADTLNSSGGAQSQPKIIGGFSVTLTKVKGSLGFSLSSTDDTILNHSIKAILRDPALSDGRIQPGDKLVSANGVDLSSYNHQELISFLRQCDETVTLGLFRDASRSGTPLDAESPPVPKSRDGSLTRKHLRYEAKELVRSLQSSRTSLEKAGLAGSQPGSYSHTGTGTLGRRRVRNFSPANTSRLHLAPHNQYPGPGGENSESSEYLVSTPGTGGGVLHTPGSHSGEMGTPRLYLHQATPPPRGVYAKPSYEQYFSGMEDSNRNSIPRTIMREGTPPTFLTNEQSRSLPRGMPLFSTPEQDKSVPFRRPTDLNLNKANS